METAVIVCSRPDSSRVPRKIFHEFPLGKKKKTTLLGALLSRLKETGLPIILAVPEGTREQYEIYEGVYFFEGYGDDPLKRMSEAAKAYAVENVIRVCHDKIFIDQKLIERALQIYRNMQVDYLFSSFFVDGSGFEIIRAKTLHLASTMYDKVEHISYAIKSVTQNVYNWAIPSSERSGFRLLADTPKDMQVLEYVFKRFKTKTLVTPLHKIIEFLRIHPEITSINSPPELTIYTCCYNGEKYLPECLQSVARQKDFNRYEYLLIDDCSTDSTPEIMQEFEKAHTNVKYFRNEINLGLASSSNVALANSSGRYITRLDADDYYSCKTSARELVNAIRHSDMEAIYPANFFGSKKVIQPAEENHHIGGAIFRRRSINDIKFTDGLKGYEGLDFWHRARNLLRIGYLSNPVFFYRQHESSLSKNNLEKRAQLKKDIVNGHNHAAMARN